MNEEQISIWERIARKIDWMADHKLSTITVAVVGWSFIDLTYDTYLEDGLLWTLAVTGLYVLAGGMIYLGCMLLFSLKYGTIVSKGNTRLALPGFHPIKARRLARKFDKLTEEQRQAVIRLAKERTESGKQKENV